MNAGAKCPKNTIRIRSYKKRSGVRVRTHCTPDRGAPGRTPRSKRVLPKLKNNEFVGYGYSTKLPSSKRHSILKKICRDLTYSSVIKRLVVLRSYNKRSPKLFKKFDKDIKSLQAWHKGGKKKRRTSSMKKRRTSSMKKRRTRR